MSTRSVEEPLRPADGVTGSTLPQKTGRQVRDAARYLWDNGYAVSPGQARHLVKRWMHWRRLDARRFVYEEFVAGVKRGDLLQVRTRPRASTSGWRTSA